MPTNPGSAFANSLLTLCHQLQLDWTEIASRLSAGQSQSLISRDNFSTKWTSVEQAYNGEDFALKTAQLLANTPSHPALLACLCSPNLGVALERFNEVVPEAGLRLENASDQVIISFNSQAAETIPASLQVAILGYVVAVARLLTDKGMQPLQIALPQDYSGREKVQTFFGVVAENGPISMTLSTIATTAPLRTCDTEIWSAFEMRLTRAGGQDASRDTPYVEQVQEVLYALLPTGCSTVEHVAENLAVSKRTLQRKLSAEGQTYQRLLHRTRKQLAHYYLSIGDMSVAEIAVVLSYRDPHSFLRAYRGWTGQSPSRSESAQIATPVPH